MDVRRSEVSFEVLEIRQLLSTYYVSPGGSDASAGGSAAPFATLQHAANLAKAGDTVIAEAGNYAGFNIPNSGAAGKQLVFQGQPGATITTPVDFGGGIFGINSSGMQYITVQGFTIAPSASSGPAWNDAIRIGGLPDQWTLGDVVQNNTISLRLVNQSSTPDFIGIFASWADGLQIQNNNVSGGQDSAIYVSNSSRNYFITDNLVANAGGNGIHNNGDAGQGGPGINTNAVISGNVIHHVGFGVGGQAISGDGLSDSLISNNLIYDAFQKGISLYHSNASGGSQDNVIVGNTVIVDNGGYVPLRMADDSTGNVIYDNVFQCLTGIHAWCDLDSSTLGGGTQIDHNVNTGVAYVDGGNQGSSWSSSSGWGFDQHSKSTTDPTTLFANFAGNDDHLKAGSPAIGVGVGSFAGQTAPGTDLAGNPRPTPGGGYDAGAYQYSTQADTTPPTVISESPGPDDVPIAGTAVTVTFSESIQPSTLSFTLTDAAGNAVVSSVSYNDATHTATLTPNGALGSGVTYTATVSDAMDLADNAMTAPVSWSFTTATLGSGPFTLWPTDPTPGETSDADTSAVELGTEFTSDVAGYVTGVEFYKGAADTGTHVGHLWDANGNLLASVTFIDETASGWQQATFSSPVAISSGTTYVISYLAPNGGYAKDLDYFDGAYDATPLHAPAGAGLAAYGVAGQFPTHNYSNANYWVEPIVALASSPQVVGRYVFYNDSSFDGNDSAASATSDAAAIATDKQALLPGQTATFANYTSYAKGINGIAIDISSLPANATLSASDFSFRLGNDGDPSGWTTAPAPASITLFRGAGVNGSDRIEIIWADGAVEDQWMQIGVLPTADTGLEAADVFYFGNAVGETDNDPTNAIVNTGDDLGARNNKTGLAPAAVTNRYDFNRDGRVDTADELIARDNHSGLSPLGLITPPSDAAGAPASGVAASDRPAAPSVAMSTGTSAVTYPMRLAAPAPTSTSSASPSSTKGRRLATIRMASFSAIPLATSLSAPATLGATQDVLTLARDGGTLPWLTGISSRRHSSQVWQ